MKFSRTEENLGAKDIHSLVSSLKEEDARYVQILAVNNDESIDLVYTFMTKDLVLKDFNVYGLAKDAHIESITDLYYEAFVCENEIHELFGPTFDNLVLDFSDKFYTLASDKPMTVISPEELARREKEAKIKAALEAKRQAAQDKAADTKGESEQE